MKLKRKHLKISLVVFIVAVILAILLTIPSPKKQNSMNNTYENANIYSYNNGTMTYAQDRGIPEYHISFNHSNETFDVYNIDFMSRNFINYTTHIYGLLFLPKNKTNLPGVVLMPGGGVTKESESKLAGIIADMNYAVITIDQRGIGQTGGYYLSLKNDYDIFAHGFEPVQHLSVYDVLRTYDVLRQIPQVNPADILLMGESMGGRYATIAASEDKSVKGLILISSSGYDIPYNETNPYNGFFRSIDPDHYIAGVSPRPVVMIHNVNDPTIPIQNAKITFSAASEPKQFYAVDNSSCTHGYCDAMHNYLKDSLQKMLR